jgi:hypothetical protein
VAKRPRFSRWRRLPQVYRSGEFQIPESNSEPQRLTLYIPTDLLDAAELQAARAGVETLQRYCEEKLCDAIHSERMREQAADVEARQGALQGLREIADDPEYLAEWNAQIQGRAPASPRSFRFDDQLGAGPPASGAPALHPPTQPLAPLDTAIRIVMHHAGFGTQDPSAFLTCLRRGESILVGDVAELARALQVLERELRSAQAIDRQLAFALHRLAYESQVLHTDAWPGAFDSWTVDALRAVQESVERILSGQDIRYRLDDAPPENPH